MRSVLGALAVALAVGVAGGAQRPRLRSDAALAEGALEQGLRAMAPEEREAFWEKLRRAREAKAAETTNRARGGTGQSLRRRTQSGNYSVGACLGYPTPPSMERNADSPALNLVVEVDDGNDLNILASHVAKVRRAPVV